MYVDNTPVELASLEKLDHILMAQRIVFIKIIVMPKGQQRKVKGAICNVPVECDQTILKIQYQSSFQNQINDLNGSNDNNEEIKDPFNEHRMPINQTCLQSIIPNYPVMVDNNNEQSSGNEIYSIAPGENKHLFSAKSCLMSFV